MGNFTARRCKLQFLLIVVFAFLLMFSFMVFQARKNVSPVFSVESGFYEDAFYLEISVPKGYRVYYTLDSSIPDENSIPYSGPIYIDNASDNPNTYSTIGELSADPSRTIAPDYCIDKCTVIRAVAISDFQQKQSGNVITKSYFVGFSPESFDNCGVISLVSAPENLFSSETGIYVTGDIFEAYRLQADNPDISTWDTSSWADWPANYNQRGREWEREANITFWDANGNLCLQKDIGIRIQGNWSRGYVPKGLNLYAREEYDGQSYFSYDFFDNALRHSSLTLTAGGSAGQTTMLGDYLMGELAQGLAFDVKAYRPYVLFLDGEYWGFYWLTERYDTTYLQEKYDLGVCTPIIVKQATLEEGSTDDLVLYYDMLRFFLTHDLSIEANYERACELIDIDSFIDYYATQIYVARNRDWPRWNEAMWRTREISDAPYADGKWRWMLFDHTGNCMTQNLIDHNTLEYLLQENVQLDPSAVDQLESLFISDSNYWKFISYFVYGKTDVEFGEEFLVLTEHDAMKYMYNVPLHALWNNATFRSALTTRILEIGDQYFDKETIEQFLENYRETMLAPLSKTWARFPGSPNNTYEAFNSEMNSTLTFFNQRRDAVSSWIN